MCTQACAMLFPCQFKEGLSALWIKCHRTSQHIGNHPSPHTQTHADWVERGALACVHIYKMLSTCGSVAERKHPVQRSRQPWSMLAMKPSNPSLTPAACGSANNWHQNDPELHCSFPTLLRHLVFRAHKKKTKTLPRSDLVATRWLWQVCGGRKW